MKVKASTACLRTKGDWADACQHRRIKFIYRNAALPATISVRIAGSSHAGVPSRHPTDLVDAEGHENSHGTPAFEQIIGNSPAPRHVLELVNTVASSESALQQGV